MTSGSALAPLLVKEARALLPLWGAAMATLIIASVGLRRWPSDIAVIGYIGGVFALAAHAIGHEYGYRTLPIWLAQPAPRARLFAAKGLALATLLATLAAVAAMVFSADGVGAGEAARMVLLPILGGVFTAPLFTMWCRSTLAGAVLGPSAPMTFWVAVAVAAWWGAGVGVEQTAAWFLDQWVMVAAVACPPLAILTWHTFARMEAVDGPPAVLTLPRWMSRARGARRHSPWRALVAKEVHLQQMTIAITLLYGAIWALGVTLRQSMPSVVALPVEAVLLLYCLGLTVVIGALASAEERQLGILESQRLQPVGAAGQWAVKCAVALGLALILGLALPAALIATFVSGRASNTLGVSVELVLLVIVLTSSSLYLSSLTSSGVKAMAWSVPAGIGVSLFIQTMRSAVAVASTRLGAPLPSDQTEAWLLTARLLAVLVVPALLWFGFLNHTSADHPWRRTLAQLAILAALVVSSIIAGSALI